MQFFKPVQTSDLSLLCHTYILLQSLKPVFNTSKWSLFHSNLIIKDHIDLLQTKHTQTNITQTKISWINKQLQATEIKTKYNYTECSSRTNLDNWTTNTQNLIQQQDKYTHETHTHTLLLPHWIYKIGLKSLMTMHD